MTAYLVHIPLIAILSGLFYRSNCQAPLRTVFWPALVIKLMAGIGLGLVFTQYYTFTGDTVIYFTEGTMLGKLAQREPLTYLQILLADQFNTPAAQEILPQLSLVSQPRGFFMSKLTSLISIAAFHNYWIISAYFSLFSFSGLWIIANRLAGMYPSSGRPAALAFLFFPSVVFWSSGLTKESVATGCIAWITAIVLRPVSGISPSRSGSIGSVLWILPLLYLLWKLKFYYLAALLPVLAAYRISAYTTGKLPRRTWSPAAVFLGGLGLMLLAATVVHPSLHPDLFIASVVENHDAFLLITPPENAIHFHQLKPALSSLALNFPLALFSGLFRPLVWEGRTVFQVIAGLENTFLLGLTVYALLTNPFKEISRQPRHYLLLLSALIYIVFLAALLAFSTPNLGTLVRYKIAFLPFLVYLSAWAAEVSFTQYRRKQPAD